MPFVGLIQRAAEWLGINLSTANYASAWSDNSNLAHVAYEDFYGFAPFVRVTRANAIQLDVVDNARNAIAGTSGRLALYAEKGGARAPQQPALLGQFERGVPMATTLTWTYDDLLFNPHAWWHVLERDSYGWPVWGERVKPEDARLDSNGWLIRVRDVDVRPQDIIRFDSPLGAGLLENGATDIRRAISLEISAALAEDNPVPTVELHNEGAPLDDTEREALLDAWQANRRKRGVAYTPKDVKVIPHGQQKGQLLIEGRRAMALKLVRHANLPAWAASTAVEGATMTYDNRNLRNWELIDLTLAGFFTAVAGRLSMNDVTPRDWKVKVDTDDLTKPDQKTRFETYGVGKTHGFIDNAWIAAQEGWTTFPEETPA